MSEEPRRPISHRLSSLSLACAAVAVAVGVVRLSWSAAGLPPHYALVSGFEAMKANTAVGAIAGGGALALIAVDGSAWSFARAFSRWGMPVARALGAAALSLGALTLAEYVLGRGLGIDELLFRDLHPSAFGAPGRMAPASAVSLALYGIGILWLTSAAPRAVLWAQICGLAVLGGSATALLGYAYGVPELYRITPHRALALDSALAEAVLGAGILLVRGREGLTAVVASAGPGGVLARRLLLFALIVLPVLGWLCLFGQELGLFDAEFGLALLVLASVVVLGAGMLLTATSLNRAHEQLNAVNRRNLELNERLEQRVQERTAELEAATRELEAYAYSVAHDLRSPLRAIDGFSHILESEYAAGLEGEARELIRTVRANAQKMGRLIDDLLQLYRVSRAPMRTEAVDMSAIVAEAVDEFAGQAAERGLRLEIGRLPPAWGDRRLLKQAWVHLLSNAVKYTARRDQPRVEVQGAREPDRTVYSISDNGEGFDMRYVGRLFGVFQRLHADAAFPGTGVGLAIVKRIVDRHRGTVWAESSPGLGARFSFALPKGGHDHGGN